MTDRVNISPGHTNVSISTAQTFKYAITNWVEPGNSELIAGYYSNLAAGPYNAFDVAATDTTDNPPDATIDTGEAQCEGATLARDTQTTINLDDNKIDQDVYLGWAHNAQDTVKIGKAGAFNADDERFLIYTFDTADGTVDNIADFRPLSPEIELRNERYETDTGDGIAVDAAQSANTLDGLDSEQFLRSDQADRMSGKLTIDTGESGIHLDLTQGDIDNVDDIIFVGGAIPHVFTPNTADGVVQFQDRYNDTPLFNLENGVGINFLETELLNLVIDKRSSRPSNPSVGQIIYRTDKDG